MFHAELAAREAGNLTLAEALELVCLYAEAEPAKFERAALRWHAGSSPSRTIAAPRADRAGVATRASTTSCLCSVRSAPSESSVASEELVGAGGPYLCGELRAHGSQLLSAAILEQVRDHQGDRAPLRRAA